MGSLHRVRAAAAAVLALVVAAPPAAEAAAAFVPHYAIYGLSLARSLAGASSVVHAVGKLEFTWADVCDGWTVNQRTHINLTNQDGSEVEFGWTLSSWESKDGLSYRFFIRRLFGGGRAEELQGEATLTRPGGPGEAVFSQPQGLRLDLPVGTVFPTHHSLELLKASAGGDLPLWRIVFDGTGDEGLFGINAVLAESLPASVAPSFDFALIRDRRSWRMNMAHFALDDRSGAPAHEQSLRLFDNGIVDELILDYGDFALDARLAELKALPAPDC